MYFASRYLFYKRRPIGVTFSEYSCLYKSDVRYVMYYET